MGTHTQDLEGFAPTASESGMARLRLDIEQYERLLQTGLGPRSRTMFEHLLARVKAELVAIEAEETASRALLAEVSALR
jgi:hypothetical protein